MERNLFKRSINDHEYEYVLTSVDNMDPNTSIEKCKYYIRKRGTNLDRYGKKYDVARDRTTRQFDPYKLYPEFEDDRFEGQGMG